MELFSILRSSISGEKISKEKLESYSSEQLHNLFKLASGHDLAHLLAYGLKINGLISSEDKDVEKYIFKAVYRHERTLFEYKNLCDALENAKISFLPLKGSVIRQYYPQPWMRTSCDIDILVQEKDIEKATSILVKEHSYIYKGKSSHDVSLFTPSNVHVELHYNLIEEGRVNYSAKILNSVWERCKLKEGFSCWYEMSDEMFYFYHVSHMAKHFEEGGCGIRPFIDLWILDNIPSAEKEKRNQILNKGNLLKFADSVRKLSCVWFEDEEHNDFSLQMENYILRGGVYGSSENRVVVQQQKKGGRVKYALSKIFLPYDIIKFHYPILQKHKWLTPIMEIRRWFKLLFCGHAKRSFEELKYNKDVTTETAKATKKFLEEIGL